MLLESRRHPHTICRHNNHHVLQHLTILFVKLSRFPSGTLRKGAPLIHMK